MDQGREREREIETERDVSRCHRSDKDGNTGFTAIGAITAAKGPTGNLMKYTLRRYKYYLDFFLYIYNPQISQAKRSSLITRITAE